MDLPASIRSQGVKRTMQKKGFAIPIATPDNLDPQVHCRHLIQDDGAQTDKISNIYVFVARK